MTLDRVTGEVLSDITGLQKDSGYEQTQPLSKLRSDLELAAYHSLQVSNSLDGWQCRLSSALNAPCYGDVEPIRFAYCSRGVYASATMLPDRFETDESGNIPGCLVISFHQLVGGLVGEDDHHPVLEQSFLVLPDSEGIVGASYPTNIETSY